MFCIGAYIRLEKSSFDFSVQCCYHLFQLLISRLVLVRNRPHPPPLRSVAAVHKGPEVHTVKLLNFIDLRPRHSAVITAFTNVKPIKDMEVAIESRILLENEMSCKTYQVELERVW